MAARSCHHNGLLAGAEDLGVGASASLAAVLVRARPPLGAAATSFCSAQDAVTYGTPKLSRKQTVGVGAVARGR